MSESTDETAARLGFLPFSTDPCPTKPGAACSFCGIMRNETGPLVGGPNGIHMCGKCVDLAKNMIDQWRERGLLGEHSD